MSRSENQSDSIQGERDASNFVNNNEKRRYPSGSEIKNVFIYEVQLSKVYFHLKCFYYYIVISILKILLMKEVYISQFLLVSNY